MSIRISRWYPVLIVFFISFTTIGVSAQSEDNALNSRLNEYMKYTRDLNFEKLMDYIYPKLFKMAPREAMVDAMKSSFENETMKITLDSLEIGNVSAPFVHEGIIYREISYSMVMDLRFLDTSNLDDPDFVNLMKTNFSEMVEGAQVTFERNKNNFHIRGKNSMLGVKEKNVEWTFIGTEKNKIMAEFLFPKEVIKKFNLF
jgi:hypothetical protein